MPEGVGYGDRKPGIVISMDFLDPNRMKKNNKEEEENEEKKEALSYAELAKKRLMKKNKNRK